VTLGPDGSKLAFATNGTIHLESANTHRVVTLPMGAYNRPDLVSQLIPTHDGTHVIAIDWIGRGFLIDWMRGTIDATLQVGPTKAGSSGTTVVAAVLSAHNEFLITAGDDRVVRSQRLSNAGGPPTELFRLDDDIFSVDLSANDDLLAVGLREGAVQLFSVSAKQSRLTMLTDCTGEGSCRWIAAAPSGLFESEGNLWADVRWRFDNNTFDSIPVGALLNDFYYTGLLQHILQGATPDAPRQLTQVDRHLPRVDLLVDPDAGRERRTHLRLQVSAGSRDLRLFRNGALIQKWAGPFDDVTDVATDVMVTAGENAFSAYAFNAQKVASPVASVTVSGSSSLARPPTLYVLAIGINAYDDTKLALKFARPDAELVASAVEKRQERSREYGIVSTVLLTDADASRSGILEALDGLKATVQPEDDVIVYFAGHGIKLGSRFYFLPRDVDPDASGPAGGRLAATSLSDQDIERTLGPVDAARILVVLDACQSGQLLDTSDDLRRGPINANGLAQLAFEKHIQLVAASQAYQNALEWSVLGHGLLTYAMIVEGFEELKADTEPRDGHLTFEELARYAVRRVPQLQTEQGRSRSIGVDTVTTVSQQPRGLISQESSVGRPALSDPWAEHDLQTPEHLPDIIRRGVPPGSAGVVVVAWSSDSDLTLLKDLEIARQRSPNVSIVVTTFLRGDELAALPRDSGLKATIVSANPLETNRALGFCNDETCYLPSLLFFDRDGVLRHQLVGSRPLATLEALFTELGNSR
jgi:hypothetical protein